jgi:hypothetical protein
MRQQKAPGFGFESVNKQIDHVIWVREKAWTNPTTFPIRMLSPTELSTIWKTSSNNSVKSLDFGREALIEHPLWTFCGKAAVRSLSLWCF